MTEYVWPRTLVIPPKPPKLVYLDLNHWIALAKAHAGHKEGARFRNALSACEDALDRRAAIFPISDTIYMEISKIGRYRQRRSLREVIERVSRFLVVTSRSLVSAHEIEALLDTLVGPNPGVVNTMSYIDWGVGRAFGMVGGFRIRSIETGEDVTDQARLQHPEGRAEFDRRLIAAELELNRRTLDGPTPEEEPELRKSGWVPYGGFEVMDQRARQEIDQVARFDADPRWRKGRVRDVVAARELMIEINESLSQSLSQRRATLDSLFPNYGDASGVFDAEPVKRSETRPHEIFCISSSGFGLLIQARPGSGGGVGARRTNRSGWAA